MFHWLSSQSNRIGPPILSTAETSRPIPQPSLLRTDYDLRVGGSIICERNRSVSWGTKGRLDTGWKMFRATDGKT